MVGGGGRGSCKILLNWLVGTGLMNLFSVAGLVQLMRGG